MIPSFTEEPPFFETPPTNLNHAHSRPKDTPFEDGTFKLTMEFTEEYPNKPPTVRFVSKMFHPNGINTFINYVHTHTCTHTRTHNDFFVVCPLLLFVLTTFLIPSMCVLSFSSSLVFLLFFIICPLFFLVSLNLSLLPFLF